MSAEDELDPCLATARYFDGASDDEGAALDHLASCARCQAELGDLVGLEVALGRTGTAASRPAPTERDQLPPIVELAARRRRWPIAVGGALVVVATAAAAWALWPRSNPTPAPPTIALATERAVEARVTGGGFAAYRPYAVNRAATASESISLETLAAIERGGDPAALFAAHLAAGDPRRARAVAEARATGPARDADLAALALVEGDPAVALEAADRALAVDASSTAARWNRALALRELGLVVTAAAEFTRVVDAGEPGWADEARTRAAALAAIEQDRAATTARFTAAAEAMVDRSGPPLTAADVERHPGLARGYFLEALRTAVDEAEVGALAPLAAELDRVAGTDHATTALTRTRAKDLGARASLARTYRDVLRQRAPRTALTPLLATLRKGGATFDDLRFGALNLAGELGAELAWARRYAAGDPWHELAVERERARVREADGAYDDAEAILRAALADCDPRRWGHRCAQLAFEVATLYGRQGRFGEAADFADRAVRGLRAVGDGRLEDHALSYLADLERSRGRSAIAMAMFVEVAARAAARDCATRRYAQLGAFLIAVERGLPWPADEVPAADACGIAPSPAEVAAMIDRADATGAADDRTRARTWLAAAALSPEVTAVLTAVLDGRAPSPAQLRAVAPSDHDAHEIRPWAYRVALDRAAAAGAWAEVVSLAGDEIGAPPPAACALIAARARGVGIAVAVGADGVAAGERVAEDAPLPSAAVRARLDGCAQIAVIARPPLHGRAAILPVDRAWSFVRGVAPSARSLPRRVVVVGDALPPAALSLPALTPVTVPTDATAVRGGAATPAAVLRALAAATYVELHVHGQVDLGRGDASYLALSPDGDGRWALTAADLRGVRLAGAPVIVLAACKAAAVAPLRHARWSLPDAFLAAGARAVIAPATEIPDGEAAVVFAAIRERIEEGASPAAAVAAERAAAVARGQSWAASLLVFE